MKIPFTLLATLFPLIGFSAQLECKVSENLTVILQKPVTTQIGIKQKITSDNGAVTYITEKENSNFDLESFVPEYEARIYSSGIMTTKGQRLGQTIWNRNRIYEIYCSI